MTDVSSAIVAKSDQLNADDLIAGPMTVEITGVSLNKTDQPVVISYIGDNGKPYKPCKSMARLLVHCWTKMANTWVGKKLTLYNEPSVKWAGKPVGGVRISHLSDIAKDMSISLTVTRGQKKPYSVKKLVLRTDQEIITEGTKAADKKSWFNSLNDNEKDIAKKYRDKIYTEIEIEEPDEDIEVDDDDVGEL